MISAIPTTYQGSLGVLAIPTWNPEGSSISAEDQVNIFSNGLINSFFFESYDQEMRDPQGSPFFVCF